MPVLPDWPASPPTVRCGRTSISTVTLLVGGEMPWVTPTETPGAMYFPALSAVPPVALPLAALGFRVPVVGPVGPEPNLNQSRPRPPRRRSRTPGPPPARVAAAAASCSPSPAVIWPTPRLNSTRERISSCGTAGVELRVTVGAEAKPPILTCAVMSAALASAMMSRTGSSFGLPSKVIAPRGKVKVFPSRSTLPRDLLERAIDRRRSTGAGDRQLAAPFAFEPMAAHKDIAGHIYGDVERRRKRRV